MVLYRKYKTKQKQLLYIYFIFLARIYFSNIFILIVFNIAYFKILENFYILLFPINTDNLYMILLS